MLEKKNQQLLSTLSINCLIRIMPQEIAKKWLRQAEGDLVSVKSLLDDGQFYASAFFSQQSAEKALKAVCINNGLGLIRSHDLILLGQKAKAPEAIIERAGKLSVHYAQTRYPDYEDDIPLDSYTK
ncbi:MAG: HEPN domain-containing protein, partial [Candidatus Micrarchaeota archaeon]